MTLQSSWACALLSIFLTLMDVIVLLIKPDFSYALNDECNYMVVYQKWLRALLFVFTIIISVLCIYFAVNYKVAIGYGFLALQSIIVYCYILVRYKKIIVSDGTINVYRFMRKEIHVKFNDIAKVNYVPNAKIQIVLKTNQTFDASFNSDNFNTLYMDLLNHDIKFITGNIPTDSSYVYISMFDITIDFPKNMFREFYQGKTFFRNSHYLFSARNLETLEYIEGYYKNTDRELPEFIDIVKNDLNINGFKPIDNDKEVYDGLDFTIIKAIKEDGSDNARLAYIYHGYDSYFVIYADYLLKNETTFANKMKKAIRKSIYEDTRSSITRV